MSRFGWEGKHDCLAFPPLLDLLQITPTHFKIAFPPLGRQKR
jgi:hypothetical protein